MPTSLFTKIILINAQAIIIIFIVYTYMYGELIHLKDFASIL